jgi:hypothetical protein
MLRAFLLSIMTLASTATLAIADPAPGDDLATCRDRQSEL